MVIFIYLVLKIIAFSSQQLSLSFNFTFAPRKRHKPFALYTPFISEEKLCIGSPPQCLTVQFDPGSSLLFVLEKNKSDQSLNNNTLYNNTLSTFSQTTPYPNYYFIGKMIEGTISFDTIAFGPLQMNQGTFCIAQHWDSDLEYSVIGLNGYRLDSRHPNFISKLKQMNLITKAKLIIEIIDDTHGQIHFNKQINPAQYRKIESFKMGKGIPLHYFFVSHWIVNKEKAKLHQSSLCYFEESSPFTHLPFYMNSSIYSTFLHDKGCRAQEYEIKKPTQIPFGYLYYVCPKATVKAHSASLSDLTLVMDDGSLTLFKENMFEEFDEDNEVFTIVLRRGQVRSDCVVGRNALKDYLVERDFEKDLFIVYEKIRMSNNTSILREISKTAIWILCLGIIVNVFSLLKGSNYLKVIN